MIGLGSDKKMKGGGEKEEKRTQPSHNGSSLKSANDSTGKDLQLELEIEKGWRLGSLTTATVHKHLS